MKVAELIALLQQQDPEAEVLMEDVGMAVLSAEQIFENNTDPDLPDNFFFHEHQRLVGVETGYTSRWTMPVNCELSFTLAKHSPASDGVPAVRLMGANTPESRTGIVRQRTGPALHFVTAAGQAERA